MYCLDELLTTEMIKKLNISITLKSAFKRHLFCYNWGFLIQDYVLWIWRSVFVSLSIVLLLTICWYHWPEAWDFIFTTLQIFKMACNPPKYGDLGKEAKDLLNKNYCKLCYALIHQAVQRIGYLICFLANTPWNRKGRSLPLLCWAWHKWS